jgi:hypothetical protein
VKIAYLILAHNSPRHLQRLLEALHSDAATCFIHLDRKTPIRRYRKLERPGVRFLPDRIPVYWGDISSIDATLRLLNAALADPLRFDRLVLLSGADYPLESAATIERFFALHPDEEFLHARPVPSASAGKPLDLFTRRVIPASDPPWRRATRRLLLRAGWLATERDFRRCLGDDAPYGGSAWWAITRDAGEYILDFLRRNPGWARFFRETRIPDEIFYQTLLANSPLRVRIAGPVTFADWEAGGLHPPMISDRHLKVFHAAWNGVLPPGMAAMLFARKFSDQSKSVVKKIRRRIAERDRATPFPVVPAFRPERLPDHPPPQPPSASAPDPL